MKPGAAFWATVAVALLPVLYVVSLGPACWWFSPTDPSDGNSTAPVLYLPIGWVWAECPNDSLIDKSIRWYATLLRPDGICVPRGHGSRICAGPP